MLLNFFTKLEEYKVIVFSTSKEAIKLEEDDLDEGVAIVRRNMSKQTREVIDEYEKLKTCVLAVKDNQDKIED
jgi:hypothetical protein